MANTAKKTAKTTKTATKTNTKVVNIKTNKSQRKAKTEKPDLSTLNSPLFSTVIDNTEKLAENAKTGLSYWKAIGDNLIEIRKNWIANGGDIKARGEASFRSYRDNSSIGFMSKQDVSDAILIAQNWSIVTKIDDTESLNGLGVSACKKAIKAAQKPTSKQGPATSDTSKKSKKTDEKSDTGIDLSSLMTDPKAFGALIGKLVNSKYTDEQKAEFVKSAGEHIIIAETK
tara:strand:+ start:662 stop:1348 length:687 start_codon:yes stop_codon:yes gene_type:complete